MSSYNTQKTPHVTYFPTLTGGVGADELERFYDEFFLQDNPPSTRLTLLSRTIGADRIVDEVHITFKHTQEMPWILPGVPATGKRVEVLVVSIVTVRGGKVYSEHVYWDQASVLVQTGLLNPGLVPQKVRRKLGVEELPVVGRAAAHRLLRGAADGSPGEADNELLPGWYEDDDEEEDDDDEDEEGDAEGEEDGGEQGNSVKDNDDGAAQRNGQKEGKGKGESSPAKEDKVSGTNDGADAQDSK